MKRFIAFVFVVHFVIITISVLDNIHVLPQNIVTDVAKIYSIPFFEQNWGMFSNPPTTTRRVYFKFQTISKNEEIEHSTHWYDVNASIYNYNKNHLFSIAQRLIKFESSCINNIFHYVKECKDETPDDCLLYSPGFLSLKNYARIIYKNSEDYNPRASNVRFLIKIVEEHFPRFEDRKKDYFDKSNYQFATHTTSSYPLY